MTSVYLRPNESFESLLRRFKRSVERSGILTELKLKEYYEKPSQAKKRKAAAARKRELKRQEKTANLFKGNKNFKFSKDHTTKIPLPDKKQQERQYQARSGQGERTSKRDERRMVQGAAQYSERNNFGRKPYQGNNRPYEKRPYQGKHYQTNKPQNKG